MPGKSDFLSDSLLNHVFRTATFAKLANVYVSLHSADPTDANLTATELTIGVNGYSRVAVPVADSSWQPPAATAGVRAITNTPAIVFGTPSGDWNSGNPITHFGIYSAATAGNLLYSGALGTPRVVLSTDNAPTIAAGALQIQEG